MLDYIDPIYYFVTESIIDDAALTAIHGYSQGNPRLIDNLMTDALAFGSQAGKKTIDTDIILAAVDNQNLTWWSF